MRMKQKIKNIIPNLLLEDDFSFKMKISAILELLVREAKKYNSVEEFIELGWKKGYSIYPFWHLTDKPSFKIFKTYTPIDYASSSNYWLDEPGLMATQDIEYWVDMMKSGRLPLCQYAVELDLSQLRPEVDYKFVDRGLGNEIWIEASALDRVKIARQISIADALQYIKEYKEALEELFSVDDLQLVRNFYNQVTIN